MRSVGVLLLLCLCQAWAQMVNITALVNNGIDIVALDTPSFLTSIQRSRSEDDVLVFGETTLREIASREGASKFVALPVTTNWAYTMQDLHSWYPRNSTSASPWTIGVTDFDVDMLPKFQSAPGPYLPLMIMSPSGKQTLQMTEDITTNIDWSGKMFSSVRVDPSNMTDVLAYYAGWTVDHTVDTAFNNATILTVNFGVVRTHVDTTEGTTGFGMPHFRYNPALDVVNLYPDQFSFFSPLQKPWVHVLPFWGTSNDSLLVVADPNTRSVYAGIWNREGQYTPHIAFPQFIDAQIKNGTYTYTYTMVSCTVNYVTQTLYVGLAVSGYDNPGLIAAFNLIDGTRTDILLTQRGQNPKALVLDDRNNTLYVGLNGGTEVFKIDLSSGNIVGYQRLPEWLHRTWDGIATRRHLVFITNEQHSKVYRINKLDFCKARCPMQGFCYRGTCKCSTGYTMNSKGVCVLAGNNDAGKLNTAKSGEVALGLLFMFTFIAAAAGWFMYFRQRKHGAYQSM